jgi:hypothetical protein
MHMATRLPRTRPADEPVTDTGLDEFTKPAESYQEPGDAPSLSRGTGWDTYRKQRAQRSTGAHRLDIKDEEVLLRFLQPEPFALYEQHWVGSGPGARSYTCIEDKNQVCPLCQLGYNTRYLVLFNVYDVKAGENKFWPAGPNAVKEIEELSRSERYSPIDKDGLYFAIKRTKQDNGFFAFKVTPVKERDLADDFGADPMTDDELKEAAGHLFDDSVIPHSSREQLEEVASKLDDE